MRDERILIAGLGNPILGDDGAGWKVVEGLRTLLASGSARVEMACFSLGGLALMEHLQGYERAILVDAMDTGQVPAGTVRTFPLEELGDSFAGHFSSAHDTSLQTALEAGRQMGLQFPKSITVVAIEATTVREFSEQLSPPVAAAVPTAVQVVLSLI